MSDVTNAPVPLTIQDKEYLCAALTDRQLQEFTNWVRAKYIERAVETAAYLDRNLAVEMRNAAFKTASTLSVESAEGLSIFSTAKGAARVLYLMQLEATKDTFEGCLKLVEAANEEEVAKLYDTFNQLMNVEEEEKK